MIISEKKSPIWKTKSLKHHQQQQQQQEQQANSLLSNGTTNNNYSFNLSNSKASPLLSSSDDDLINFTSSNLISPTSLKSTGSSQNATTSKTTTIVSNFQKPNFECEPNNYTQNSPIATTYLPGLTSYNNKATSYHYDNQILNDNNQNLNKYQHKQLISGTSEQQSRLNEQQQNTKLRLHSKSSSSSSTSSSPLLLYNPQELKQQLSPLPKQNLNLPTTLKTTTEIAQGSTKSKTSKNTKDITSIQINDKNNINNSNNSCNNSNVHIQCHSSISKLSTKNLLTATTITQKPKSLTSGNNTNHKNNNNNDNSNNPNIDNASMSTTRTTAFAIPIENISLIKRYVNNDNDYYDDSSNDDNLSTKNLISMDYNSDNQYNNNNSNSNNSNIINDHNIGNSKLSTNRITISSSGTSNNKNANSNNENNGSNSNIINNNNNNNGSYGNLKTYNSINNSTLYNGNINVNSNNNNNDSSNSNHDGLNTNNSIDGSGNNSSSYSNGNNSSSSGDDDDDKSYQKQKYHYSYSTYSNNSSSTTYLARCCLRFPLLKAINVKRCVLGLLVVTLVTIFYYTHYVDNGVFVGLIHRDTRPAPLIHCRMLNGGNNKQIVSAQTPDHRSEARLRIDPKVLVFVETTYSRLGRDIAELLVYNRIKYKIEVAGKSLPVLTNLDKGRYGVIVFENLDKYLHMDKWNRELLDKYCREYSVGIVGFVSPSEETLVAAQLRGFPVYVHTNLRLRDASLNPASSVLRLTRAGDTAWGLLPGDDWAIFQHNHSTYEPIEWAQRNTQEYPTDGIGQVQPPLATVLQDHGQFDGIQRIFFGSSLRFWLHRLLFLDALSYLSHGQLSLSLNRMILVDIDDIFVGEKGTRLRPDDVLALIATQKRISEMVPGFRFNLGFSGKYYHHGTHEENLGDDLLLRNIGEFNWFSHMWNHQQPHLYENLTILMNEMLQNYGFAKDHGIPTDSSYSVSPHHSGVYPAHELLYTAWKKVWNIKVTSTEEYPHLRPARLRRGFIHRNIMVLPRQTCGLFTHTMYIDRYPGGRDKLDESIQGGELFQTIVYNPINIFMTHMSNYGSDRLALYTFESVIKFLRCWTNLKLSSAPPLQLGETYFRLHPEESDPVWGNPCEDPRHLKIWSKQKDCDSLPKFLVIGPQKTGTTALYTFLSMHPSIASNIPSPDTFEEIQFFNGNNYYRGLDWYMTFFPTTSNTTTKYMFEKSATYFDGDLVPRRSHALLPHAKIVTILISPAKRAYSWYQHTKAHGDLIANNYSFYQVITASDTAPKALKDLRNRCLNPGKYAQHLERWLAYYPTQQLHIIDGEQLKSNPIDVMNELQRFLKIQPPYDYSKHLRFDNKKGFYCQVVNDNRNKCLGKSKGRQYPPMDERSLKLLQRFYLSHNTALVKLLKKLGSRPIPQWLKDDLSTTS